MADKPRDPEEELDDEVLEESEDAGREDDEGGDEAETGQEPEATEAEEGLVDEPPAKVGGRATQRIHTLREQLRQEADQRARVQRELEELRAERQRVAAQPQEEPEDQFRARLALMTSEERVEARLDRADRVHRREMAVTRFSAADSSDKASFEAKGAYEPRYKKYAAEVEQTLAAERRAGRDFPRETILKFILGQKVLEAQGKPNPQRMAAEKRVQRQQSRTSGGGSDRPAQRQQRRYDPNDMSSEAVEARLSRPGVFI